MAKENDTLCMFKAKMPTLTKNHPFDLPSDVAKLSKTSSLHRFTYPDGHVGWLVTSYSLVRNILLDKRFSARSEFKRAPVKRPGIDPFYGHSALPGWMVDMDSPEHMRYKRPLSEHFSMKRIKEYKPRIEQIVREHLDVMEQIGPVVDLVESFALPIPSLTICELLGVPYSQRREFQRNSIALFSLKVSAGQATTSIEYLTDFLHDLVQQKRRQPAGDLLSTLIGLSEFNDEELAGLGVLLLTAGHETTANMLALGTFALLSNPEQLAQILEGLDDPLLVENAVEELLRYLTIFQFGVPRTPLEDVAIEGNLIKAGESVTLLLPAANRDSMQFENANQLDINRSTRGHLAFGFGIHYCMGRNLARLEMQIGYREFFRKFPSLHLAVPANAIELNPDAGLYGIHRLPVACWK